MFAAVLVARIVDRDRRPAAPSIYGVALAGATYLALLAYVDYPATAGSSRSAGSSISASWRVIWWSAHKLTWDCTHIDEKKNGAAVACSSAAGLDADVSRGNRRREAETEARKHGRKKEEGQEASTIRDCGTGSRSTRRTAKRERKAAHTPGRVGALFRPGGAAALRARAIAHCSRRRQAPPRTFLQMVVYIAQRARAARHHQLARPSPLPPTAEGDDPHGDGRRLARPRRDAYRRVPVLGAFLPRPHSEVPWFGIQPAAEGRSRGVEATPDSTIPRAKERVAAGTSRKPAMGMPAARAASPAAAAAVARAAAERARVAKGVRRGRATNRVATRKETGRDRGSERSGGQGSARRPCRGRRGA